MKSLTKIIVLIFLFSIYSYTKENIIWESGKFKIEIMDENITIYFDNIKLTTIKSLNFNFTKPFSFVKKQQSSDSIILQFNYPTSAGYRDQAGDFTAEIVISVKGNYINFRGSPGWAYNTTIQLEDGGEQFFGLLEPLFPNNQKIPNLRGETVDLEVIGNAEKYLENYASIWSAFFFTNKGYASFFDTFAAGKYRLGINNTTEIYHQTGKLNWYIIAGNNGDEVMKTYYEIIGRPKFVPIWACGPIGWRDENKGGKDEILQDIQKMTELKIPFTAWFVDRPYCNGANGWSKMDFNENFSHPEKWINTIKSHYGLEFMTWIAPLTFEDTSFPGILPGTMGYFDLTNPDAVKEFGKRLSENQHSIGVKGHKMDRADQLFPHIQPWHDGTPLPERRNRYVYLFSRIVDSLLHDNFGDDQVNFARAAFHRCQPHLSAVWGGDPRATWDGIAANLANGIRCSFMGFPIWGSDVGGYFGGKISEKLYARWLQLGVWSGLYEIKLDNAGGQGEDRPPWKYSEKLQHIFRECNNSRMELLPFFYSLANTSYKNGVIMKPLAYVYPEDEKTYKIWDQFIIGNTFLVAPILDSTDSRIVYLPEGEWIDFYDKNKTFIGNQHIRVTQPIERIPVFIKKNSLYVSGKFLIGNSKLWEKETELTIHLFPGENGENVSFGYIDFHDSNKEKLFIVKSSAKEIEFRAPILNCSAKLEVKLEHKPSAVLIDGKKAKFDWNEKQKLLHVKLQQLKENEIIVRK